MEKTHRIEKAEKLEHLQYNKKFDFKDDSLTFVIVLLICILQGFCINGFYVKHEFLSGGITGVGLLLDYAFNIPSFLTIIVLNIPVIIVGLKYLDLKMVVFSIIGTVLLSLSIYATSFVRFPVEDPMMAAVAGGAVLGILSAPVVKRGATLGGTDVLALILSRKYSISMGNFSIIFNILIMSTLIFFKGLELSLVSILAMFVCNVAFNFSMEGLNRTHTVFIISDKWDEIAPMVLHKMHRGVTYIPAQGAYTGKERKLVYCIVRTVELAPLKRIVRANDAYALISVIDTREVNGRGFGALN